MNGLRYEDVFTLLDSGAAILVFLKANGDVRVMLGTRSLAIASKFIQNPGYLLQSHDKRCNRSNGNIALLDLEISEPRSFKIDRLVYITKVDINTPKDLSNALEKINKVREEYEKHMNELDTYEEKERQEEVNDLFASDSTPW